METGYYRLLFWIGIHLAVHTFLGSMVQHNNIGLFMWLINLEAFYWLPSLRCDSRYVGPWFQNLSVHIVKFFLVFLLVIFLFLLFIWCYVCWIHFMYLFISVAMLTYFMLVSWSVLPKSYYTHYLLFFLIFINLFFN